MQKISRSLLRYSSIVALAAMGSLASAKALLSQRTGDFVLDGPFTLNPKAVAEIYSGLPVFRFGTFEITMPDDKPLMDPDGKKIHIVRDLHYRLYKLGTKEKLGFGLRFIPVADGAYTTLDQAATTQTAPNAQGQRVTFKGSEKMDEFLRRAYGYEGDDLQNGPIYAILAYMRPKAFRAKFTDLPNNRTFRLEGGMNHMGVYLGNGTTRNSPVDYHNWSWEISAYPAHVSTVAFKGAASQKIFNTNAIITLKILNELNGGPLFPNEFKSDLFRAVNLKETMDFYHGWLDPLWVRPGDTGPYLKKLKMDDSYAVYCAEHVTIALNAALNLAQNEQGYREVWGDEVGSALWKKAQQRWKTRNLGGGTEGSLVLSSLAGIPSGDANYTPLWKLKGIKPVVVNGKQQGILADARAQQVGFSLAWPPETTADIIRDFVLQYADWTYVGPVLSSATVMGFIPVAKQRMGVEAPAFTALALPIITPMFRFHAATQLAALPEDQRAATLDSLADKYSQGLAAANLDSLTSAVVADIKANRAWILGQARTYASTEDLNTRMANAGTDYRNSVKTDFLRATVVDPNGAPPAPEPGETPTYYVKYYTPPAVIERIVNGWHESERRFVRISTVATAIEAESVEPLPDGQSSTSYDPTQPVN
ncbi:MAG: hypothetical protein JST16_07490 [Bdellovibrionales bacterium]|nr:hypothetical protein [Bdellovibrionales bacterium]